MKNKIYLLSIFILIVFTLYVFSIFSFLKFIFTILLYWSIFYLVYFLYKKFRKQKPKKYYIFLFNFFKKISLSFVILAGILGFFWYYEIYISPAKMIEYTISNWNKLVVFQEMSHIWSQNFYNKIKNNLINYKKQGFVYFFEWVRAWTKENMQKFNKAIGIKFNKDLYKNFSKLYGLTFQDNKIYLGLVNNQDFNIDVWVDWIIKEYEKLGIKNKEQKSNKEVIDVSSEIIQTLSSLNDRELAILRFVNKAILGFLIKSDKVQELISNNFANKKLFKIILDGRNKVVSDEIENSKYKKIYITYWKLHFDWIFKLLKQKDSKWHIISKKEINCIN